MQRTRRSRTHEVHPRTVSSPSDAHIIHKSRELGDQPHGSEIFCAYLPKHERQGCLQRPTESLTIQSFHLVVSRICQPELPQSRIILRFFFFFHQHTAQQSLIVVKDVTKVVLLTPDGLEASSEGLHLASLGSRFHTQSNPSSKWASIEKHILEHVTFVQQEDSQSTCCAYL